MNDISFGRSFSEGWAAFQKYAGLAIGGFVLYMVIAIAAEYTGIGAILALFPLVGGVIMLFLGIVKNLNPPIGTLFAGFSNVDNWARWLGLGWLLALYQLLVMLVCAIPAALLAIPGVLMLSNDRTAPMGIALLVLAYLFVIFASAAYTIRWIFVFFAGAEGATAFNAIRSSEALTEGLRWQLFWIVFLYGLINLAGALFCGIGIIFTGPVTQCGLAALYLDVKQFKLQAAGYQPGTPNP